MYFKKFPYVGYQFPDNYVRNYKNISIRPAVADKVLGLASSLEDYSIQDGETPETIAFDFFDDANLHWVIMLVNNVMNIYNDWPKTTHQLESYLIEKYKTQSDSDGNTVILSEAETLELIEFTGTPSNDYKSYINGTTVKIQPHHFKDADGEVYSYDTKDLTTDAFGNVLTTVEKFPVSIYEYEFELNEEKRNILLPSTSIVQKMNKELAKLLNE